MVEIPQPPFSREEWDANNINFLVKRCGYSEFEAIKAVRLAGQLVHETSEERDVSIQKAIELLNGLTKASSN